ncbi:MAG: hypothetical protein GXY75_03905 [Bacteroidales bacterium]|nr:hypothetical protein [Bacteroidales bacterium]
MINLFGTAADDRGALNYFSYRVVGGMRQFSGFSYQVSRMDDGRIEILINEDFPDQKRIITSDETVFSELQAIIDEHNMTSYKGRYEPPIRVLDADSWYFDLKYEYGFTVRASGVLKYPRGGAAAFEALKKYFEKWEKMPGEEDSIISPECNYDTVDDGCTSDAVEDKCICDTLEEDQGSYNVISSDVVEIMNPVNGSKMTRFRFNWLPDNINHICYYVDATTEDPTIYFSKGNREGHSFAFGLENMERLRSFVSSMKVDNTYEDATTKEGTGNWYLTINFDSGDILGINGRITNPRTEEEKSICDPIHNFFKPIIEKMEKQMEEREALLKEAVSNDDVQDDSGRKEEQSLKSAARRWWQFWK